MKFREIDNGSLINNAMLVTGGNIPCFSAKVKRWSKGAISSELIGFSL